MAETISGHHADDEPTPIILQSNECAECFGKFSGDGDTPVEVINEDTGQIGKVHTSCYEANDDVLSLRL